MVKYIIATMDITRWAFEAVHRHPLAVRMFRAIHTQLYGLLQYFTLIFGSANHHVPIQPSEHCVTTAKTIFSLLQLRKNPSSPECNQPENKDSYDTDLEERNDEENDLVEEKLWQKVLVLLQDCTELETLIQVVNNDGFNVLLAAVLQADYDVLRLLLNEGCNVNQPKCTLPLHLACKLGNRDLVQFLLENHAKRDLEAGMCYPGPHQPTKHVPSRFHFLETDIFACDSNHRLPIMYAIQADNLDIVRCLLEFKGRARDSWPYNHYPLHYACKKGSYNCMMYLAEACPKELNTIDTLGMAPLHYAVQWGKMYVKFLIEAGANVHVESSKKQGALHILYHSIKDPLQLYETSKFLLGTGMEQDVSRQDSMEETPLHAAILLVNCKVTSFKKCPDLSDRSQTEFDEQTRKTIDLLLAFNCDPNLQNSIGLTALQKHVLLVDYILNNDPGDNTLAVLPDRTLYNLNFPLICQILDSLLRHGSDANQITPAGWTPVLVFLQSLLKLDASRLYDQGQGLVQCLKVLCNNGANVSLTRSSHINTVTILARLGFRCLSLRDEAQKHLMSDLYKAILAMLLQSGLHCNHCIKHKPKGGDAVSGNILVEIVKLAQFVRQPADLTLVHTWVLTLLQWGADPDIEPYPSDPIICQSQSSIFLKPKGSQPVNQYIYEIQDINQILEGGYAEQLLMLFYNSMDHEALYQCLGTAKFLSRFDPNSAPTGKFLKVISRLASQPRSLKQICRVTISKSLNRNLPKVHKLPLPTAMKNYVLNIE